MIFEQMQTGGDRNFGYLLGDRGAKEAVLIDPSYQPELLVKRATVQGMRVKMIFNTHGHGDHTNGNCIAQEKSGAEIALHSSSAVPHDRALEEGDQFAVGDLTIRVLYTPGHSQDHITLFCLELGAIFTGDHLFVGKVGGTGTEEAARLQYESLHRLFKELPETTTVWPGHDVGCRPSSTLALEKLCNPFVMAPDFSAFFELKGRWARFKQEMGLI